MKTVKQVSKLTGLSVRMLHYYDEIGLLKPSKVTDAGYRLYDDEALLLLQQILFYKELDIPLKEVKEIMYSPDYDKKRALENQKKLLIIKCNRLKELVGLIDKTLKGENAMSFKEFDMTVYYNALEEFKNEHKDKILKEYGSIEKYNKFIEGCKSKETEIKEMAIKQYGSIEKFVQAMKKNFNSDVLFTLEEQCKEFRKDFMEDKQPKLKELFKQLIFAQSKDPSSKEIQQIAKEITKEVKTVYPIFDTDRGIDFWSCIVQSFLVYPDWMQKVDEKYGKGASQFIGKALKISIGGHKSLLEKLYDKLIKDLNQDPHSKEIQDLVCEIKNATEKENEALNIDEGENWFSYMAEQYLSSSIYAKAMNRKYGEGTSKFIGEAFKFYSESNAVCK